MRWLVIVAADDIARSLAFGLAEAASGSALRWQQGGHADGFFFSHSSGVWHLAVHA